MSHLWTQVFAQMKHHVRPGETPLDALNGILREVYGGAAITTAASIRTRTLTRAESTNFDWDRTSGRSRTIGGLRSSSSVSAIVPASSMGTSVCERGSATR